MKREQKSDLSAVASVIPAVISATANGTSVDLKGFNAATVKVSSGAIVAAGDLTVSLEDSPDNSVWTAVAADDLVGAFEVLTTADTETLVGYRGAERYLRAVMTLNGGTSIILGVAVIKGLPDIAAVA